MERKTNEVHNSKARRKVFKIIGSGAGKHKEQKGHAVVIYLRNTKRLTFTQFYFAIIHLQNRLS